MARAATVAPLLIINTYDFVLILTNSYQNPSKQQANRHGDIEG